MRLKDDHDGAEPAGNSIALLNLLRLHRITGRDDFEASARQLIAAFSTGLAASPWGMPQMLAACEFDMAPPREVVVAGDVEPGVMRLLAEQFDPNRVLLHASPELVRYQPAVADMSGPAVFMCENFTCNAPVSTREDLARLLK